MKSIVPLLLVVFFCNSCSNKSALNSNCYKGRLEIKAICSNYTIKLLEGPVDTSSISSLWTDDQTGKSHQNVFALANPCSFPKTIAEGDEFYFTIRKDPVENCMVCQAYYPKPSRALAIEVLSNPCR